MHKNFTFIYQLWTRKWILRTLLSFHAILYVIVKFIIQNIFIQELLHYETTMGTCGKIEDGRTGKKKRKEKKLWYIDGSPLRYIDNRLLSFVISPVLVSNSIKYRNSIWTYSWLQHRILILPISNSISIK